MDTPLPPTPVEPVAPASDIHTWKVVSGVLSILLLLCVTGFAVLFQQIKFARLVALANTQDAELSDREPIPSPSVKQEEPLTPGNIVLADAGLQFKVSRGLGYYEPFALVTVAHPFVRGSTYCVTFTSPTLKGHVPLCGENDIQAVALSSDWDGGREMSFLDAQGFVQKGSHYVLKMPGETELKVTSSIVKEVVSTGGLQILFIEPQKDVLEEEYGYSRPRKGYMAGIVNTKSEKYPGLVFLAKIDGGISRQAFEELLLSLKTL